MKRAILLGSLVMALGIGSATAHADTVFTLTQDGCSGGSCGAGPFGTVTLSQTGTSVTVTVNLASNERFAGTGAGDALEFNVTGAASSDIGNITSGFAVGPSPDTASTFGSFGLSVTCTTCQGGQIGNPSGPLSFTVANATIADFVANIGGYYFASDLAVDIPNGKGFTTGTGNVASDGPGVPTGGSVPEPSTLLLLGTGLTGLGGLVRRKLARS